MLSTILNSKIDAIPPERLHELCSRTLTENQPELEIVDNYLKSLQLLGEVAQIMFHFNLL